VWVEAGLRSLASNPWASPTGGRHRGVVVQAEPAQGGL